MTSPLLHPPAPFVPDNCTEGSVRLLSGFRNGTVQVCVNRTWGSICDSGWSSQDADVVCRQLGFNTLGTTSLSCDIYSRVIAYDFIATKVLFHTPTPSTATQVGQSGLTMFAALEVRAAYSTVLTMELVF